MKNSEFDEKKLIEIFEEIRNKIQFYKAKNIFYACVNRLNKKHETSVAKVEELRLYSPWLLYLLIKWTIRYGDNEKYSKEIVSEQDFFNLVRLMHDYWGAQRGPLEYGGAYLFIRTIAAQQFWLQEDDFMDNFGRQLKFFSGLPQNHYFEENFFSITHLHIDEFLELLAILLAHFQRGEELFITKKQMLRLLKVKDEKLVENFFSVLSKNWEELRRYFETNETTSKSYEFVERTPLYQYPLLNENDRYYSYSYHLLRESSSNMVYRLLRANDPERFMTRFGAVFEKYIDSRIQKASQNFIREATLKRKLKRGEKIIDFIITETDSNIFIDAKGNGINNLGMVSHQAYIIRDKLKASIIKGVQQYYSTVNQLIRTNFCPVKEKDNYLIIVTNKELYLSSSAEFFKEVAPSEYSDIRREFPECEFLELNKIFFMSIEDFDLLTELILKKEATYGGFLKKVVEINSHPETKKLIFRQHLLDYDKDINFVPDLKSEFDRLIEKTKNKMIYS